MQLQYIKLPNDAPEGTVAPCLDADNLNRIEQGIADNKNLIEKIRQIVDELAVRYVKACDFTTVLTTVGNGVSWTATEDCWASLYADGGLDCGGVMTVNGVEVSRILDYTSSGSRHAGGRCSPVFVKAGSIIKVSSLGGYTSSISGKIFGCL